MGYTDTDRLDFLLENGYVLQQIYGGEYILWDTNGPNGVDCTLYGVSSSNPRDLIDIVMNIEYGD